MTIGRPLQPATFLRRLNRFAALVHMAGREAVVHLPNSGRLHELLTPGRPSLVVLPAPGTPRSSSRRTEGELTFMLGPCSWVSVDARLPGRLFAEALVAGRLAGFEGHRLVRLEYRPPYAPRSRLDVLIEGPRGPAPVETKSVTLVEDGTGLFPDAPTARGRRHLQALAQVAAQGRPAHVVFVVQRPDVRRFAPHRRADPEFARALEQAAEAGVQVRAYACSVQPPAIEISREIPVSVEAGRFSPAAGGR